MTLCRLATGFTAGFSKSAAYLFRGSVILIVLQFFECLRGRQENLKTPRLEKSNLSKTIGFVTGKPLGVLDMYFATIISTLELPIQFLRNRNYLLTVVFNSRAVAPELKVL